MNRSILIEICYEINPLINVRIPTKKWNNIFPKLMSMDNVHYVSAFPKDNGIELTVGYRSHGEPGVEIINLLEEKIKDDSYNVCFMQTKYAEEKE